MQRGGYENEKRKEREGWVVCLRPEQGLGKQGGGMFSFIFSTQLVERHRRERERQLEERDTKKKWERKHE